ncbi:FecR family protein [Steroidobacter sp.]|uniref:FecR family protein n=1 Tax=Steroidobacter sp. TaxID=1978227 RepID=UPI001A5F667D|nr:FecR domain-containing protein [Steroidobacter sp.]MBL8265626.1 FecR domain-containing protein [Steroidobacter sp.]
MKNDVAVQRYREATEWLLKLDDEQVSEADLADWLRWCERDAENLQAFERMQADWNDVKAIRARTTAPVQARPVSRANWKIAAAIAGLAVLAGGISWSVLSSRDPAMTQIAASTANKTTALPDGSSLTLRAQAVVQLNFDGEQRRLELQPDSGAYFKVHHDANRPFVVRAGDLTVQAVGTAFDVRREAEVTSVTVEEGKVRISAGSEEWFAAAGERFEFKPSEHRAALSRTSVSNALRWRDGEFAYDGVALSNVLRDINRYSTRQIRTADDATASIPYSGTVFVRSIDDWLLALESSYPVNVVAGDDGSIVLKPSGPP